MAAIEVAQEGCEEANAGTTLWTQGLDTCIGIVAYGLPATQNGVNKVLAHSSTGQVAGVIGDRFVRMVQNSRMQVTGISLSCPMHDRNDHGPGKVPTDTIKQAIATKEHIHPSQVTNQQVEQWRADFRMLFSYAQAQAESVCRDYFGIEPEILMRDNARVLDQYPYGVLLASPSPNGEVWADNTWLANIPDGVAQTASSSQHSGSHSSGHGGSSSGHGGHHSSSSGHSGRPSGHGGSSSGHGGHSTSSSKPGGYSTSSSKPGGYSTSSSKPGGYSTSSSKPSSGSSVFPKRPSGSIRPSSKPSSSSASYSSKPSTTSSSYSSKPSTSSSSYSSKPSTSSSSSHSKPSTSSSSYASKPSTSSSSSSSSRVKPSSTPLRHR